MAYRIRALNLDPGTFFQRNGKVRRVHELTESERLGIGLEAKIVDGELHYLPVFPSPEKSADALQKMFGMNKEKTEVSGPNGGPIKTENVVKIYIPDNGRD